MAGEEDTESFDEPNVVRNACTCRFRIYRHDPLLSVTLRAPRPSSLSMICKSSHGYLAPQPVHPSSRSAGRISFQDLTNSFGIQPSTQPTRTRYSPASGFGNMDPRFYQEFQSNGYHRLWPSWCSRYTTHCHPTSTQWDPFFVSRKFVPHPVISLPVTPNHQQPQDIVDQHRQPPATVIPISSYDSCLSTRSRTRPLTSRPSPV